ncbi:MAG: prepilin-type N-terminal cleavage/methylation domain-containing protein, partial [Phycisphaerae bacterium]|nr:prepilin-type N-terminal cleavage/methylation domain-containing protein [Phycisphaerae bacterium]
MKRMKGLTLVELLVVVAVIAMVVTVLVLIPRGRPKELSRQAICGANLKNIGTGVKLYQAEYDDCTPWIDSGNWLATTGTNAKSTTTPGVVSPTALMFLLVRTG